MLYDEWVDRVGAYVYRRTWDAEVTADIVAETFAVAWRKRRRFRPEADEAGRVLFGIARNELAHFRRRAVVRTKALRRLGVTSLPPIDDESISRVEELVDAARMRDALRAALETLSTDQRAAIEMRVVEGRAYREVAGALGCTESAARVRVHRGLTKLARTMGAAP